MLTPWKESYDQPRQHIKKQRHYFASKGPSSQGYDFSSSYVWIWEVDYKESWTPKNWCFWTVVLEKTLASPLDCKEIQPVHPKGGQSWVFIGRSDVEVETPILWPPDVKSWLIWKTLILGNIEGRRKRGWQWMRWLDGITDSMDVGLGGLWSWWWTGRPGMLWFMGSQRVGHNWATELNWMVFLKEQKVVILMKFKLSLEKISIYLFWLRWVFVATRGLSLVAASWGYSSCHTRASHCDDFYCCKA